jgi:hypothetical protein
MLTTLIGVKVRFRGDVFETVRLDDHRRFFEISNGQETHMKSPMDFLPQGMEEFSDVFWVKFQDAFLNDAGDAHDTLEILVKKDASLVLVLDKLRRFGFKISVNCHTSTFQCDTTSKDGTYDLNSPSLALTARSDSFKSANLSSLQGKLVIGEDGHGTISLTKQSPMQFHSLRRTQSENSPIAEAIPEQTLNYNENLVTDISNEFDIKLPKDVTKFKFPLLPEFVGVARVRFIFQKDWVPLRLFSKPQVFFLGEKIVKISDFDGQFSDQEVSRQQLYMLDERTFSSFQRLTWTPAELRTLFDSFVHEFYRYVCESYQPEKIQIHYKKEVKRRLDEARLTRSSGDIFRAEVRAQALTPIGRLRKSVEAIAEYRLTLRVLERFIEAVIKAFDVVVMGLSKLIVYFFTFKNPNFKLSKFTGYLMKLVAEEISDLRNCYSEVFWQLLTRNTATRSPEEIRFLKELWIAKHATVFADADIELLLQDSLKVLVEETSVAKFAKLRHVQSKFESLWESFS